MIKQSMTLFIQTENQKQLLMKVILMMYLNQSILLSLEKGSVTEHKISISKYNPLKLPK